MSAPVELPAGPFEREPVELGRAVGALSTEAPAPDVIVERTRAWLSATLAARGVELGSADRDVVEALAVEGWSVAQTVAGWVARSGGAR